MNQFFYETRGKEKVKGLMDEGMRSQALHRSGAAKPGILRNLPKLALTILGLLGVLALIATLAGVAYAATGTTDPQVLRDLAGVRQATAKYHDVNTALADGFVPTPHCIEEPGLGGMGIHYINPARIMNPAINLLEPEILLYLETNDGMKLLGVEYMFPIGPPDAPIPDPAPASPILFGRPFDGPMLGHEPGMPPHYDLHAWVWKANPSGIFTPFNPSVSCQ